jgi:protoheme IX farnesyltransferase
MTQGVQVQDSASEGQQAAPQWLTGPSEAAVETHLVKDYIQLIKPRIALLIVISTAVGYCYGTVAGFNLLTLFNVLLGTALMAGGSATLNQWYERDLDAKMNRTRVRPIPAGRVSANQALLFGVALSILGTLDLWFFTNPLATLLGVLTSIGYLFAYTPLKRVNPICTTIGALPGAMPPLIGFAAARGYLSIDAWVLFGILFLWQFPHFHAIAWIYREDYKRAGIKMLAVVRPMGVGLTVEILGALLLLLPVTLAPTFLHMAGKVYFVAAFGLDLAFFYFGFQLSRQRSVPRARRLLLASVIYMPILFAVLVFDSPRFYF